MFAEIYWILDYTLKRLAQVVPFWAGEIQINQPQPLLYCSWRYAILPSLTIQSHPN